MFKILVVYESNYLTIEIKAEKPHLSIETADFTVVSVALWTCDGKKKTCQKRCINMLLLGQVNALHGGRIYGRNNLWKQRCPLDHVYCDTHVSSPICQDLYHLRFDATLYYTALHCHDCTASNCWMHAVMCVSVEPQISHFANFTPCEELVPILHRCEKLVPNFRRCEELVLNLHRYQ